MFSFFHNNMETKTKKQVKFFLLFCFELFLRGLHVQLYICSVHLPCGDHVDSKKKLKLQYNVNFKVFEKMTDRLGVTNGTCA